jgi:hypothetical protein
MYDREAEDSLIRRHGEQSMVWNSSMEGNP